MSGMNSPRGNCTADARDICTTEPAAEGGAPASSAHSGSSPRQKSALTRRGFLKTTGALAGAAAIAGGAGTLTALADDAAEEVDGEQTFRGVCRGNCQGCCPLDLTVRNGKIAKIAPGDFGDDGRKRICSRGFSHISRIYHDHRLKYPMRRIGERGEGEFERISWEDAISEIADTWKRIQSQYGKQAVAFSDGTGNLACLGGVIPGMLGILRDVLDATYVQFCIDFSINYAISRIFGSVGMALGANEPTDMVNSKSIFLWGANITGAQPHDWHLICDAMEGGTKLVVIDPQFTHAAAHADIWVPIRPGTDGALYMGIMNRILELGGEDSDFLRDHSCAPFLVREDNGKFLRMSDLGVEPTEGPADPLTGQPTIVDDVAVWNEALGVAESVGSCGNPAMTGTYSPNGITCRVAYDLLKERISEYPIDLVSRITDVPTQTIEQLADLVMDTPVTHRLNFGTQAYMNGVETVLAGATMSVLVGNVGYPGACFGAWFDGLLAGINFAYTAPTGGSAASVNVGDLVLPEILETGKFMGEDYPIKALYLSHINPMNTTSDVNRYKREVIDKLDFIVVADSELTDTAKCADIVLPVCQWFECEDALLVGTYGRILHSQKAIDPLYESKSDADICRLIGSAMGYAEFFPESDEEFLTNILDSPYNASLGISYESLKSAKTLRFYRDDSPNIIYEGGAFATPSGRAEFYDEDIQPRLNQGLDYDVTSSRLPYFRQPGEAWYEGDIAEKYPIVFQSERNRFMVHSQWSHAPWLRELDPEPHVKINPSDAQARGVEDGEYIEVFNDRGHAVARARYSEGVRPGTLVYPKGWQRDQFKAGSWSELLSAEFDSLALNQNFMDNRCDYRAWSEE